MESSDTFLDTFPASPFVRAPCSSRLYFARREVVLGATKEKPE